MEKLVLVGGYGFIGRNIIDVLYHKYSIYVIGRSEDNDVVAKYPDITFYKYDFLNDNGVDIIFGKIEPDYVINLVSIVTAERDLEMYKNILDINISVLLELYYATRNCEKLKLFLQFGSGEEYGNIDAPFKETDREVPSSPYALSKQLATNTALMLFNNYCFPIAVVRPGNLFGEYQDSKKFIPYILDRLRQNADVESTFGEQRRDFIYARDFAIGIQRVIEHPARFLGEVFNLSSGSSIKIKEIIEFCKKTLGSTSYIEYGKIPYRENEMMRFELDITKFERLSGSGFNVNVFESLACFIEKKWRNLE